MDSREDFQSRAGDSKVDRLTIDVALLKQNVEYVKNGVDGLKAQFASLSDSLNVPGGTVVGRDLQRQISEQSIVLARHGTAVTDLQQFNRDIQTTIRTLTRLVGVIGGILTILSVALTLLWTLHLLGVL